MSRGVSVIAVVAILSAGCGRQSNTGNVLARVGERTLTEEEARNSIDTSLTSYETQLNNYVMTWVNTELLYQEAVKQGVENSDEFQRRLTSVRQHIAVQQFLDQYYTSQADSMNDEDVQTYFSMHMREFSVREDMMKLNIIGFALREHANVFAASVTRGSLWERSVQNLVSDTASAHDIVYHSSGMYYTQQTILFPELWKVASTLTANNVSFPIRTLTGYYVVQLLASVKRGDEPTYDIVEEEAKARYRVDRRQRQYDTLRGTLRQQYTVEVMLPAVPRFDTTQKINHD